jgi:hypothetical protein
VSRNLIFRLKLVGAFAFLWILHLSLRLPLLKSGLWLDEAAANLVILENKDFFSLRRGVDFLYQPILDFVVKKYFWFRIFEFNELSARIISIFYSSINLAVWYFGTFKIFSKNRGFALSAAFFLGIWFCFLPYEIEQAGEARTYALVALASSVWFFSYYFFRKNGRLFPFLISTMFYLNSHFFVIPMVVFFTSLLSLEIYRKGETKRALSVFSWIIFLILITAYLSFPSLLALFSSNVSSTVTSGTQSIFMNALSWMVRDLELLIDSYHWKFFAFPILFSVFYVAIFHRKEGECSYYAKSSLLGGLIFFPLFFLLMRVNTEFPLKTRYLLPFLGFAIFPFLNVLELFQKAFKIQKLVARLIVRGVIVFLTLYSVQFLDLEAAKKIVLEGENFSQTNQFYNRQMLNRKPTFSLAYPCWCRDISNIYWNHIEKDFQTGEFLNAGTFNPKDCEKTNFKMNSEMRFQFKDFLKKNDEIDVILVDCSGGCKGGGNLSIQDSRACISLINKVRSEEAFLRALKQMQFPAEL